MAASTPTGCRHACIWGYTRPRSTPSRHRAACRPYRQPRPSSLSLSHVSWPSWSSSIGQDGLTWILAGPAGLRSPQRLVVPFSATGIALTTVTDCHLVVYRAFPHSVLLEQEPRSRVGPRTPEASECADPPARTLCLFSPLWSTSWASCCSCSLTRSASGRESTCGSRLARKDSLGMVQQAAFILYNIACDERVYATRVAR